MTFDYTSYVSIQNVSLMKIPSCPLPVWKNLYDAATMFRELACWEWMSDSDLFGVQNPQNGEIGYCCVLGELGEVFGLAVYLGTEGLEQYRKIQSGKIHRGSPEMAYSQNCLTLWFGDRSDLEISGGSECSYRQAVH